MSMPKKTANRGNLTRSTGEKDWPASLKNTTYLTIKCRRQFALNVLRTAKAVKIARRFNNDMPDYKLIIKCCANNRSLFRKYSFRKCCKHTAR